MDTQPKKSKAKKTSTVPTKVYRYGVVPDHHVQLSPRDEIERQLLLGHQYRNRLVEIERNRRDQYNALVAQYPQVAAIQSAMQPLEAELVPLIEGLKARRAEARGRVRDPQVESRVTEIKAQLRGMREELKGAKRALNEDPQVEAIQDWAYAQNKLAYNESECLWGTKLRISDSMKDAGKGAPPEFRRYDRTGMIAVQIQSSPTDRSKGCTTAKLLSCTDTRVRLQLDPENRYHATLWLRIGTVENSRTPIFASMRIVYHRDLPQGEIKWCWMQRVQRESKGSWGHADDGRQWEVCIAVESTAFEVAQKLSGATVALNFGFRKLDNATKTVRRHRYDAATRRNIPYEAQHEYDRLRIGYLVSSSGDKRELRVEDIWTSLEHANGRRSNRDLDFDAVKPQLVEWRDQNPTILPEWFLTRTRTLHMWKSCEALQNLVGYWRSNRFAGDESIYQTVYSWAQRDRHGKQHEGGLRDRTYGRRLNDYRMLAHQICTQYSLVRIPIYDLAKMKLTTKVGKQESELERAQRRQLNSAAIYELVQALRLAASNTGATLVEVDVREHPVSQIHHECGRLHGQDLAQHVIVRCGHCGVLFDQDANAAENLLSMGTEALAAE